MHPELSRQSGVLLHITSLPGPYGIGDLGPGAYSFLDTMKDMGQCLWQILPTNPPETMYNCPYSSSSAFACNTILISLEELQKEGLLERSDFANFPNCSKDLVQFNKVNPARMALLQKAVDRFQKLSSADVWTKFNDFCDQNTHWLDHYAIYTHLAEKYNHINWTKWSEPLRSCNPDAVQEEVYRYQDDVKRIKILQYLFYQQWNNLREYASTQGIKIIGDIPIYVAHDSADVWANQDLFKLDDAGKMLAQSGCPPDIFDSTGQLWGHPIYNWEAHENLNFSWWIARIRYAYRMVDIIRIDHFNGLAKYWEVPAKDNNGINGRWVKAPGEKLLDSLVKEIGVRPIFAENLGEAASDAEPLLTKFGIPGMKILQMTLGNGENFSEMDSSNVVYTGTHDNDTSVGWFQSNFEESYQQKKDKVGQDRKQVLPMFGSGRSQVNWEMIKMVIESPAKISIIPLQDILGLGSRARMNTPGTVGQNWEWRFDPDMLTSDLKERLLRMTAAAGRV